MDVGARNAQRRLDRLQQVAALADAESFRFYGEQKAHTYDKRCYQQSQTANTLLVSKQACEEFSSDLSACSS